MSEEHTIVQHVKDFLRWNAYRFDTLDHKESVAAADRWGWRRTTGRDSEWWVSPKVWLGVLFDGDEAEAQRGARILRDLDLLRTQDSRNLQLVANVRGKATRVYAVRGEIRSWKAVTGRNYSDYDKTAALLCQGQNEAFPISAPAPLAAPANLAAALEQGVALALQKGLKVLALSPDPADRHYASVLRSQTAFANTLIGAQVRIDETRLRQKKADAIDRITRLMEEERERQRRLGY